MTFTQEPTPSADPNEVAAIEVNGLYFTDFDSVWIQVRAGDSYALYRFTCAERDPIPDLWPRVQFKPGNRAKITLGPAPPAGKLVVTGPILKRQVAYDAHSHGVMLEGVGATFYASRSSIVEDDKKNDYSGMTLEQIAEKVLAPTGVKLKIVGVLDGTKFVQASPHHGEPIYHFIERIARDRKAIFGSDEEGNFVLFGDHGLEPVGRLVEGVNILSCQAVLTDERYRYYVAHASTKGTDEQNGTAASEIESWVAGKLEPYSVLLTPVEHPVASKHETDLRAQLEFNLTEGETIDVNITVQGWMAMNGDIWRAGDAVLVQAPMAMIDTEVAMFIAVATYTQDDRSGTRTTLTLRPLWEYNAKSDYRSPGDVQGTPEPGKGPVPGSPPPQQSVSPFEE